MNVTGLALAGDKKNTFPGKTLLAEDKKTPIRKKGSLLKPGKHQFGKKAPC
jgi:hypothetical protein